MLPVVVISEFPIISFMLYEEFPTFSRSRIVTMNCSVVYQITFSFDDLDPYPVALNLKLDSNDQPSIRT